MLECITLLNYRSVATMCVGALMLKYGLDKDFSNSGKSCPKEAMVEVYDNAVKH